MSNLISARFDALRGRVYAESFAPCAETRRVGAEVELLAHDMVLNKPVPLDGADGLVAKLRRVADRHGWREYTAYDGIVRFDAGGRAQISFEPGGQIEVSSVVCESPTALVALLEYIVRPLERELADVGIELRSVGIDPHNDAPAIPLQLDVERYRCMTRYFDAIGPYGIRMMRQTAAIQISIDRGEAPAARWRLLNDLAPYLVAIFANSPTHAGRDTGHRSFRAHCWRQLDVGRTGVAEESDDPAAAYTRFALDARDIFRRDEQGGHLSYGAWRDDEDDGAWQRHLTTLFPEVRPRGHFEVRSCDAIPVKWYAVPILFTAALGYDPAAAREAALLASESRALLRLAGEHGLRDPAIARTARDLFQLALDGASRLGNEYISPKLCETARSFYEELTARDRSPADDASPASESRVAAPAVNSPN